MMKRSGRKGIIIIIMSLVLSNTPHIELPQTWNQVDWKTVFEVVQTLREQAFTCSKSGAGGAGEVA